MRRERKKKLTEDFTGPLWDDPHTNFGETAMEEQASASRVELEQIVDLLLSSQTRPN